MAVSVVCLAYFGFYREGCICPIGAIQNVAVALVDPHYAVPTRDRHLRPAARGGAVLRARLLRRRLPARGDPGAGDAAGGRGAGAAGQGAGRAEVGLPRPGRLLRRAPGRRARLPHLPLRPVRRPLPLHRRRLAADDRAARSCCWASSSAGPTAAGSVPTGRCSPRSRATPGGASRSRPTASSTAACARAPVPTAPSRRCGRCARPASPAAAATLLPGPPRRCVGLPRRPRGEPRRGRHDERRAAADRATPRGGSALVALAAVGVLVADHVVAVRARSRREEPGPGARGRR